MKPLKLNILILITTVAVYAPAAPPTDYDQYLLELINRGRANPAAEAVRYGISDLNEGVPADKTISTDPKPPLAFNPDLIDAAHGHSLWMLDNNTFSHTGDGGSSSSERMTAAGYPLSGSWGTGENIAWSGSTGTIDPAIMTETLHRNLFVDENYPGRGHRVNLMKSTFKEIGCGMEFGVFTSGADYNAGMVTEDFAYSSGSSNGYAFITGVAWDDTVNADNFYTPGEGLGSVTISATNSTATYSTRTWDSGGYSLAVPPGTYDIIARGGELGDLVITNHAVMGAENIKYDFMPAMTNPFPVIEVYGVAEIINGDSSPSRNKSTHFGMTGQHFAPLTETFTVRNTGGSPLTPGPVRLPDGYSLVEGLSSNIAIGGADSFTVQLDTSVAGIKSGEIRFSTNDPDAEQFSFTVTGQVKPTGVTLIKPINDIPTTNLTAVSIDLNRHFDDIGIDGTVVRMPSALGPFYIALTDHVTPTTVSNFLNYVNDGDYIDSFIHRSIPGFVIQGGGYTAVGQNTFDYVLEDAPITNEFSNWFSPELGGLTSDTPLNIRGTLSMAKRGTDPNSATSQFFVNLADNGANLDNQNGGFTVFANVLYDGMTIIDDIVALPTYNLGLSQFTDTPLRDFAGGPIEVTNFVTFTAPEVVPELTFLITTNSNPNLINATIDHNGMLSFSHVAGFGSASITIQSEDLNGATVEETLVVFHLDSDGDSYSDYDEFIADTDAADSNDYFRINSYDAGVITLPSSAARQYSLLYSTNLISGAWNPVPGQTDLTGTDAALLLSAPATNNAGYYKVEVCIP